MKNLELCQEALSRAKSGITLSNYPAIFSGFLAKGIPEQDILPRENVFTFNGWLALGRHVRRGEHGVRIVTWIPCKARKQLDGTYPLGPDGNPIVRLRPKNAMVFHVTQTDENSHSGV